MRVIWTARTRRLLFVVAMLVVLTFPLAQAMVTRARIESSGRDVVATVLDTNVEAGGRFVAFMLPQDVDPEGRSWVTEVDRATYDAATASKKVTVRVLPGRPEAHRIDGQFDSRAGLWFTIVADAIVLGVGLLWIRVGRRRPDVRMRAAADLVPADPDHDAVGTLARTVGDVYEAVGEVTTATDDEVELHVGDRVVVVTLAGHANPVEVGSVARARGPLVG